LAIKRLKMKGNIQDDTDRQQWTAFYIEALAWKRCSPHPHILPFLGIVEPSKWSKGGDDGTIYGMLSLWMQNGSVMQCADRLEKQGKPVPFKKWIIELLDGLEFMHEKGVYHLDIRSPNILVDDQLSVRIADFGLSAMVHHTHSRRDSCYSNADAWQPPEVLYDDSIEPTASQDIYSFSIFCMELFSKRRNPPFDIPGDSTLGIRRKIIEGARPRRPINTGRDVSDEMWKLLQECWAADPAKRPTAAELRRRIALIPVLASDAE